LMSPGVNLSHFNTLLGVIPDERRPEYTALYVSIVNIGAFISPLIGIALAGIFGFQPVLIGCGLLSILGSTSFWIWRVPQPGTIEIQPAA
jgi:MFS family permease